MISISLLSNWLGEYSSGLEDLLLWERYADQGTFSQGGVL